MTTRTPGPSTSFPQGQARQQYQRDWGNYTSAATLPNAAGNLLSAPHFILEVGDTAFVIGGQRYCCTSAGTAGGGDAVWTIDGTGSIQGTIAHDDPNNVATNYPVLTGGVGTDQAPVLVTTVLDMVQQYIDRAGREQVNQELSISGENIALNVLRIVSGKLTVEQESCDRYNTTTTAELIAGKQVKASPGRAYEIHILNTEPTQYTVWVCDSLTAVAASVIDRFILPASGEVRVSYAEQDGLYFGTGLYIALSTVLLATLTIPVAPLTNVGIFHIAFV